MKFTALLTKIYYGDEIVTTPVEARPDEPVLRVLAPGFDFDGMQIRGPFAEMLQQVSVATVYDIPSVPPGFYYEVFVLMKVPNRDDTREMVCIELRKRVPMMHVTPQFIRRTILSLLLHELDENIYLDGQRIFDPHSPRTYQGDT